MNILFPPVGLRPGSVRLGTVLRDSRGEATREATAEGVYDTGYVFILAGVLKVYDVAA